MNSYPGSYRFAQSRINFFTVGACERQCHDICMHFSEVFFICTLETRECARNLCDGLRFSWCFPRETLEIHLIPALAQPNLPVVKSYIRDLTNPPKNRETDFVDFTFSGQCFNFCGRSDNCIYDVT